MLGLDVAAIVLIVLASWFVGIEFRTGAITEALVRLPRRSVVITAKAVVAAGVSAGAARSPPPRSPSSPSGSPPLSRERHGQSPSPRRLPPIMSVSFSAASSCRSSSRCSRSSSPRPPVLWPPGRWEPSGSSWHRRWHRGRRPRSLCSFNPSLPLAAVHTISGAAEVGSAENLGVVPAVVVLTAWVAVGWAAALATASSGFLIPTSRAAQPHRERRPRADRPAHPSLSLSSSLKASTSRGWPAMRISSSA
ncbi:hypothetical protein IOD13_18580 [Brevibacterium casei]|nr:hypothetical protein [Brevibacterium casei]